jgi:VWFA-related protein
VKILCRPTAALIDIRKRLNAADLPLRKHVKQKPGREPKRKDVARGTKLQTAVRECSDSFMLRATGRKTMRLLTDGVDECSRTNLEQAAEHAQRADTVVYSILYADPRRRGGLQGARGRHILTELARQTGGGFFTVTKEQTLEQILDEIQAELRTQYSVGFVPEVPGSGEYRKLSLQTVRAGLSVQARAGYYAR